MPATPKLILNGVALGAISTGVTPTTSDNNTNLATTAFVQANFSSFTGTSNIVTLGTVVTGIWSASTIAIIYGGTGQTTPNASFNALAPTQSGKSGKLLTTNETDTSWSDLVLLNPSAPTAAVASGTNAIALGNAASASGQESVVLGGASNTSSARYTTSRGNQARSDIQGGFAQASGMFSSQGDAQGRTFFLRTQTTNNTLTEVFIDGTGGSLRMILPNDTTWYFKASVVARRIDVNDESAAYELVGCIDRNATAGTTALVGTRVKYTIAEDTNQWDADVNADNTNGSLRIQVTGQNAKTINWVVRVETVEVTG